MDNTCVKSEEQKKSDLVELEDKINSLQNYCDSVLSRAEETLDILKYGESQPRPESVSKEEEKKVMNRFEILSTKVEYTKDKLREIEDTLYSIRSLIDK